MTSPGGGEPQGPPVFPSVGGDAGNTPSQTTLYSQPPAPPTPPADPEPQASVVQVQSSNGSRARWAVAAVATIVVVALLGGLFIVLGAQPATPSLVAQFAPADAAAYIEVRYDLPGDQRDKLAEFMSHFPGFADQAAFEQKLDETLANALRQSDTGLDWATDVEPWFGGQIGVFSSNLAVGGDTEPSFTAVFSVSDRQQLDEVISRHTTGDADVQQEQYNGLTIWSGEELTAGQSVSFTATDEAFVVSSSSADLKAALDTRAGATQGLADDEFFLAQLRAMHADRLGLVYSDYGSFAEVLPQTAIPGTSSSGLPLPEDCLGGSALAEAMDIRAVAELRAESDHLAFRMRSEFPSGEGLPPAPANSSPNLTALMPGNTIAYLEMHQLGTGIGFLIETLFECIPPSDESGMSLDPDQLEQLLGVPVHEYFDFLVDGGFGVTLDGDKFGGGVLATVDDEAVANARVSTLLSFLRLAGGMGQDSGITVTETQHGTATVHVITIEASEVFGEPQAEPLSISLTVHGGRLYLGTSEFVKTALGQQAADSLAAQPHLAAAVNQAGAANTGVVYLDIDGIWSFVESQMPADARAAYETDGKPFIDPLSDFIVVTRNDNGINDGHGFLYVE